MRWNDRLDIELRIIRTGDVRLADLLRIIDIFQDRAGEDLKDLDDAEDELADLRARVSRLEGERDEAESDLARWSLADARNKAVHTDLDARYDAVAQEKRAELAEARVVCLRAALERIAACESAMQAQSLASDALRLDGHG